VTFSVSPSTAVTRTVSPTATGPSSETAPQIVHKALQITGILGYKNDSKFSLGRHYRDSLSGALMISNDRIASKSASMLLVFKDN